jgi:putative transposase
MSWKKIVRCTTCALLIWPYSNSGSVRMQLGQLNLAFPRGRGGARRGAGRKRLPVHERHTPHRTRGVHRAAHPLHVTLRAGLRCLRRQRVAQVVLRTLRDSNREWFRIVHYSVQDNHVHLIVEAESAASLASGMRGLAVRMARRVNRLLSRRGRFWADRWHGHVLASPREVRNALVYVLQNHKKHAAARGSYSRVPCLDVLSSACWFEGFSVRIPFAFRGVGPPCVVPGQSWLLQTGWKRRGLIHLWEAPRS